MEFAFILVIFAAIIILWHYQTKKKRHTSSSTPPPIKSPSSSASLDNAVIDKIMQSLAVLIELAGMAVEEGGTLYNSICCSMGSTIQLRFFMHESYWRSMVEAWSERPPWNTSETYKEYFEHEYLSKAIERARAKGIAIMGNTFEALNITVSLDKNDDLAFLSTTYITNDLTSYCSILKSAIEKAFPDNLRENAIVKVTLMYL